jgi:acetyl esterase/lipase
MNMETEKIAVTEEARTYTGLFGYFPRSVWNLLTTHRIPRGALLYWAALFTMSAAIMHFVGALKQSPSSGLLAVLLVGFTIMQVVVAIAVMIAPARLLLLVATVTEAVGMLAWITAHVFGLSDGFAIWRPETLWVPDLYLPIVEGISAGFFFSLYGRTWTLKRGIRRTILRLLPVLLILSLLIFMALKSISIVVFFLVPGVLFTSLQYFFLPVIALLIIFLLLRLVIRPLYLKTPGAWRTTLILLPALLLINLVTWGGSVSASSAAWLSTATSVSVPAGQTATLTYCKSSNGSPIAIDISEPSAPTVRPAPMAFFIHGGETLVGSRVLTDGSLESAYMLQLRTNLLRRGFVVGSIDYGLVPLYGTTEQVIEAKCAVRFLRAHANEIGIDPQRIGVYGQSQGGYLAAMLGTVGPNARYDVGQYLEQSSRVQAVVDMWGPTDLSNFSGSPSWTSLLVGHASPAQLRSASPAYHVAHGDPPFLIIHGVDDWFIAPHHSQDMAKRLQAAGVPVRLVMVQHDGHGLAAPTTGLVERPSPDTLVQIISEFFSRTLAA